jgi:lysophospholipase L1-like esterase
VGNFGAGGTTIALDAPTPYMNQSTFEEAEEFLPNIVVVMLGTNDASPEIQPYNGFFVQDYLELIRHFQVLQSKPQVWVVKPPQIFHNGTGLSTEFLDANVVPKIEQVAAQANLPLIDVYSASLNHDGYFFDGVHPNGDGCKLIAQLVYAAVTQE